MAVKLDRRGRRRNWRKLKSAASRHRRRCQAEAAVAGLGAEAAIGAPVGAAAGDAQVIAVLERHAQGASSLAFDEKAAAVAIDAAAPFRCAGLGRTIHCGGETFGAVFAATVPEGDDELGHDAAGLVRRVFW